MAQIVYLVLVKGGDFDREETPVPTGAATKYSKLGSAGLGGENEALLSFNSASPDVMYETIAKLSDAPSVQEVTVLKTWNLWPRSD